MTIPALKVYLHLPRTPITGYLLIKLLICIYMPFVFPPLSHTGLPRVLLVPSLGKYMEEAQNNYNSQIARFFYL